MTQMKVRAKTREELLGENENLRRRLEDAEETLRAIGSGEVDAFVVSGIEGDQVFTLKGAEHPYRVLVETMNEGAATLAADGTILYCNNRLAQLFQLPLERVIGTRFVSYVAPADKPLVAARLSKCSTERDKDEISLLTGKGNRIPALISCCVHNISGNQAISVVVTDLTQQKRNEEFIASERLARSIIEQAGEVILVCDQEGRIIRASELAQQFCHENPLLNRFDEVLALRILETSTLFSVASPLQGERSQNVEVVFKRSDDQLSFLLLNATPLTNDRHHIIGCIVSLIDITARKQAKEALRRAKEEWERTFDSVPDLIAILNNEHKILRVNKAMARRLGLTPEECIGLLCYEAVHGTVCPLEICPHSKTIKDGCDHIEEVHEGRLGGDFIVTTTPLLDEKGEYIGSVHVAHDITERKRAEELIKASLAEKEVLLKEIHHRVKNNMQVVSSLVDLQADAVQDSFMRAIFKDVNYRVRTMAMVHEKLYQSADLAHVDFADYTQSLLGYLWRAQGSAATGIQLKLALKPVFLSVTAAVPCGLILNELFTNALKHGFQGRDGGKVMVSLFEDERQKVSLSVRDDGIGLPPDLDWEHSPSLGLRIIRTLARQLHGVIEVTRNEGTQFTILFDKP